MNKQRIGIIICASVGALATFMPWVSIPLIGTLNGAKGDGWITFGFYVIPLIICFLGNTSKILNTVPLIVTVTSALLAVGVGMWKIADFNKIMTTNDQQDNPFVNTFSKATSIEFGLYLVIIAGVLLIIIALTSKDKKVSTNV